MIAGASFRERLIARFVRCLSFGARLLPHRTALFAGRLIGRGFHWVARGRRRIGAENLSYAFPELSPREGDALLKEHFSHLGMNFVEILRFADWERVFPNHLSIEGTEHLDNAVKDGKGLVVFIAHTGNWEILAPLWPSFHPSPMVIAQPLRNAALDGLLTEWRSVTGLEIVPRQGALRKLVAGLKAGRAVGLLADQDAGENGEYVPFFGRLASAESSPVSLARRLGCPLILCLTFRKPDGTHRVLFEPISLAETDAATLEDIYARLETRIRAYPAQWLWIHRRWKTRPESSPSVTESPDTSTKPKAS